MVNNEEQEVPKKKKSSTAKKILIGALGTAAAGLLGFEGILIYNTLTGHYNYAEYGVRGRSWIGNGCV